MPKLKDNQVPSYRLHRQSGQAIVTLNGRDILLGKHGSESSRGEYQRRVAEWVANGRALPAPAVGLTVFELIARFWTHAKTYYTEPKLNRDGSQVLREDGTPDMQPTGELENFRQALRPLKQLYGPTAAAAFGPLAMQSVMAAMVKLGWCRNVVNRQASRIKAVFRWAVAQELVPPAVHQGLLAVAGMRKGRSEVRESEPVRPVPLARVEAVLQHVAPPVAAMIRLQLFTGARGGELFIMRTRNVDTNGSVWVYRPETHKTAHHGHAREIRIGPQAQKILAAYLKPDLAVYVFQPGDAAAWHMERRRARVEEGKARRRTKALRRSVHMRFNRHSYARAIERGCEAAFGMPRDLAWRPKDTAEERKTKAAARTKWRAENCWHPHQLRHNAATKLRREHGLEAAQTILGHRTLTATQIYAEQDTEAARRIMEVAG